MQRFITTKILKLSMDLSFKLIQTVKYSYTYMKNLEASKNSLMNWMECLPLYFTMETQGKHSSVEIQLELDQCLLAKIKVKTSCLHQKLKLWLEFVKTIQ